MILCVFCKKIKLKLTLRNHIYIYKQLTRYVLKLSNNNGTYCVSNCPNNTIIDQTGLDQIRVPNKTKLKFMKKIPAS